MHYFKNKFSKIAKRCGSPSLTPLNVQMFDCGNLKLLDLAKLCFLKLIMTKLGFKKSAMMLFL